MAGETGGLFDLKQALSAAADAARVLYGLFGADSTNDPALAKGLGRGSTAAGWLDTALGVLGVAMDPDSKKAQNLAISALGSMAEAGLPEVPAAAFGRIGPEIPRLLSGVFEGAMNQAMGALNGQQPDPAKMYAPIANFFGAIIPVPGLGSIGSDALDYRSEGSLSAGELRDRYGFAEGTRRAVAYSFIDDLMSSKK